MRQLAAALRSHPRNDIEALALIVVAIPLVWIDPIRVPLLGVAYVVACAFVFQRWYARAQSIQDWPPVHESTQEWPPKT